MMASFADHVSRRTATPLDIVIIGGSLTGLMHGIAAKRLGHNVRILEQYESSAREGQAAGISAMEFGTAFLKKYDLLVETPYAVSCPGVQILKPNGIVKFQVARPMSMTSWNVLYYRLRANFDGLTSSYCPQSPDAAGNEGKAIYEHGKRVTAVRSAGASIVVEYADDTGGGSLAPDLVIAADGSTSHVRQMLLPELRSTYAGYAIWRGTVRERDVSEGSKRLFQTRTSLLTVHGGYLAVYMIPGEHGTIEPGERLLNYVWYRNYPEDSQELAAAMTDVDGRKHYNTLPMGKMSPTVWNKQRALAEAELPPPYVELVRKTEQPFVTVVRDIASPRAVFYDGRLLLVGDALTPFRPHVACSTNQAALNALLLDKLLRGEINVVQWERQVLAYAHVTRLRSIAWGSWYQAGYFAFAVDSASFLFAMAVQKLQSYWYG